MRKGVKKLFYTVLILFVLIQFYQPTRNTSTKKFKNNDFTNVYDTPKKIAKILKTSCYDCHSNNTHYPLYSYMQPVRYFLDLHIKEGKENLNFNEFSTYSLRKQRSKLNGILKQIQTDEMPLSSYTLIHKDAIITQEKKNEMTKWLSELQDEIASKK